MRKIFLFLSCLFSISALFAIYPYMFDLKTQNIHYGSTRTVCSVNDTILYILTDGGVFISIQDGATMENMDHISAHSPNDVGVSPNGTIFIACQSHLYAFSLEDSLYIEIADSKISCEKIAVANDSTIFVAHGNSISAYYFSGTRFYRKDLISYQYFADAYDVKIAPDGTIFVAFGGRGLRAYTFDGITLTEQGAIHDSHHFLHDSGVARKIVIDKHGTIFLANGGDGLRVYTYHNGIFTNVDHKDPMGRESYVVSVDVSSSGRVYMSNECWYMDQGIYIYDFVDSTLIQRDLILNENEGYGSVRDILVFQDSTIYATHSTDGLICLKYNESDFDSEPVFQFSGGNAKNTCVSEDGTIYLANGSGGLWAYRYDESVLQDIAHIQEEGECLDVDLLPDGSIITANGDNGIYLYNHAGSSFVRKEHFSGYFGNIDIDSTGMIWAACGDYGLKVIALINNNFSLEYRINNMGYAYNVELGNDNICYLANGHKGLYAYQIISDQLREISHIDEGDTIVDIAISKNGTVFGAYGENGIKSFELRDNSLFNTARVDISRDLNNIAVYNDSIIFTGGRAIRGFNYNGVFLTQVAFLSNYDSKSNINVMNDSTILIAGEEKGLKLYDFYTIPNPEPYYPAQHYLTQNYPNPFNNITKFRYVLKKTSNVRISIYDISGKLIKECTYQNSNPGTYEFIWDGSDQFGKISPSGMYIYRIVTDDYIESKKMLLMK